MRRDTPTRALQSSGLTGAPGARMVWGNNRILRSGEKAISPRGTAAMLLAALLLAATVSACGSDLPSDTGEQGAPQPRPTEQAEPESTRPPFTATPRPEVAGATEFASVSVGGGLTCGVRRGGFVACWDAQSQGWRRRTLRDGQRQRGLESISKPAPNFWTHYAGTPHQLTFLLKGEGTIEIVSLKQ